MKSLRRFLLRVFNLVSRRTQDERLREEIEEHIALQTEENLRAGLSPSEARRQAMLKFGGVEVMKQDYRAQRGTAIYRKFAGGFAKRGSNDSPHAGACSGDHRFAGHRNWREYNDLFLDSDDPVPTVARREWCIELSAGRASHGDGRVSRRFLAGISRLADASAGATGHRGLSDGAVQRRREGPDGADVWPTCLGQLFFCAGIEACHRTIYSAGGGGAARN